MSKILIAPSILSADFGRLGEEIKAVERAGADWLHVDVMDGHFVPNITIGPVVVKDIKRATRLPLDVHLMISEPERYVDAFAKAGSAIITFHIEACPDPAGLIKKIRSHRLRAGASIKPKTDLAALYGILDLLDMVLIMTVEPGFGGQEFMEEVVPKIKGLRSRFGKDIEVDGGISGANARQVIEAGANVLVAGTAIFKSSDYRKAIEEIRKGR